MHCTKYLLGQLDVQGHKSEVCVWSSNGELFADVGLLDVLFNCNKELTERIHAGHFDSNQVWSDNEARKFAIFPVLNEVATSIQNHRLGHFTSLSVGSMKKAALKDIFPHSIHFSIFPVQESKVTLAFKAELDINTEKLPLAKKGKMSPPSPRPPALNVVTEKSTSPMRRSSVIDYSMALPSPMPSTPSPLALNKHAFVGMFEQFYEKIEEVNKMHAILKEQTRKSSLLLQTLQASALMIDGVVKAQVAEYACVTEATLGQLSSRISTLETALDVNQIITKESDKEHHRKH